MRGMEGGWGIGGMVGGFDGALTGGTVAAGDGTDASGGYGGKAAPRPVAPVNQESAAKFGPEYKTLPPAVVGVDIEPLIGMNTTEDIEARRAFLAGYVWKGAGRPTTLPAVEQGVAAPEELKDITGVRRIDLLTVRLRYQVTAKVYDLLPRKPWNHRLALYHNGHGEPPESMIRTAQALLDRGYRVMAYAMPFHHWNAQGIEDPDHPGTMLPPPSHRELASWERPEFSTLTFFLEPLTVTLNYAEQTYRPRSVEMIGLSGGGWTTTVYSALDPRVTRSYPVAGSLPFFLRAASPKPGPTIGDFEQTKESFPGFYAASSDDFLDMYVMASIGENRGQLQILNRFDKCCFNGVSHRVYQTPVRDRVRLMAGGRPERGRWDLLEDATHDDHTISPYALSVILWDLDTGDITT
ncbi:hypothetical protein [Nonomuraea jiangxiensis]|uniref:Esterase PHB depolymerase n=1 Tax=Nonomuraea jiangxiensis TaxID=633440 RepID=A0A1G7ZHI3_9ACTN|nr:hypothetical protein [Nonomuraea jiangxiensis]SDH08006.1 hypothetical protein SAMN05421869_101413 [Nonomuraea jiangxiensis]